MRSTNTTLFAFAAATLLCLPAAAQQPQARPVAAAAAASTNGWTPDQVREAQRALTAAKYEAAYYRGTVDGIMGRKTVEAIREYQRMHQLQVTGELSDDLLAHLKANGTTAAARPGGAQPAAPTAARPGASTTPAAGQRTAAPAADSASTTSAAAQRTQTAAAGRASPLQQPRTPLTAVAPSMSRADIVAAQQGLARAKLYEGTPTGLVDAPTVAAIRAFQTAHDMTVDGMLTAALLEHLKMVK